MSLTRRSFSLLPLGAALVASRAEAQNGAGPNSAGSNSGGPNSGGPSVVELFTSQGCSSCPPADALMLEMTRQPGVVALTYPVEIWDYLGWKDTLARPAFTRRQKAYAAMVAGKRVYTPQAIVNGRGHCVGSDGSALARLKASTTMRETGARIGLEKSESGWNAQIVAANEAAQAARVLLLPFASRRVIKIGRGENSGRTITYGNVVRDLLDLGPVGAAERRIAIAAADIAIDSADGFALIVQAGSLEAPAAILGAAMANAPNAAG